MSKHVLVDNLAEQSYSKHFEMTSRESVALSIHINDGEAICIPFTTVRRFNHR